MYGVGKTDRGSTRENNEDSIFVCNGGLGPLDNLYIVSDGMGGHNAGEIASSKAIEYFTQYIIGHTEAQAAMFGEDQEAGSWIPNLMQMAAAYANQNVFKIASEDASMDGMGATFTAISIKNGKAYIVHMGDSRAYMLADGGISQLTTDHTYVNDLLNAKIISDEQARTHHLRNVITRAMGSEEVCEVDRISISVNQGDIFLICSDGLSNMVSDTEMYDHVLRCVSDKTPSGGELCSQSLQDALGQAVEQLVIAANNYGGDDNISVVLIGGGI